VCRGGGVWGHRRGGGLIQIKHLPQSPFTGQFFRLRQLAILSTFSLIFLRNPPSTKCTKHWTSLKYNYIFIDFLFCYVCAYRLCLPDNGSVSILNSLLALHCDNCVCFGRSHSSLLLLVVSRAQRQMGSTVYHFITQLIRSWIHERTISLRFLGIILRVLRFPYTMFTLQTSFKPTLLKGEGGKSVSRCDCDKEENSFPNYVQEFGLSLKNGV